MLVDERNKSIYDSVFIKFRRNVGDFGNSEKNRYQIIALIYLYCLERSIISNAELKEYAEVITQNVDIELKNNLNYFLNNYEEGEIIEFVKQIINSNYYRNNQNIYTGYSLVKLISKLLELNKDDTFIDFGSGNGFFLANLLIDNNINKVIGCDIDIESLNISKMLLSIINYQNNYQIDIKNCDVLKKMDSLYSKGYTFPPMGITNYLINDNNKTSLLFPNIEFNSKNSSEWLFIDQLISGLNGNRGIALVNNRVLFNNDDKVYRNSLIEGGYLEAIIEISPRNVNGTMSKMFLLVFSNNNKKVKIIEESVYNPSLLNNIELPVEAILNYYDSENVLTKTIDELKNSANWTPSTVSIKVKQYDNGVQLKDVADVFMGNQYTETIFEGKGLLTEEETDYKYLSTSDIGEYIIDWNSLNNKKYLALNDTKFDKYQMKKGDLIISCKSSKIKSCIVDTVPNKKVIVTGGMFIVRSKDPNIFNTTYLKTFFDSEDGKNTLRSVQKGSAILSINQSDFENIVIPLIDINKQKLIEEKFNYYIEKIIKCEQEITHLKQQIKNIK